MNTFVHVNQTAQHPGVIRARGVAHDLRNSVRRFDGTRASASLLLAAIVAALVVVANQVIDTWTEGHLLAAWIVMWAVVFAATALLAAPARKVAAAARVTLQRWAEARKQAADDDKLWQLALTDARVMADISRAMSADAVRDVRAYY